VGRNSFRLCRDLLKWQQHFDDPRMQCTELPAGALRTLRQVFLRANDRKVTCSLSRLLPCTM